MKAPQWLLSLCKRREVALVDKACEKALQGGEHGVLLVRGPHPWNTTATPNENVPYGTIITLEIWND